MKELLPHRERTGREIVMDTFSALFFLLFAPLWGVDYVNDTQKRFFVFVLEYYSVL